MANPLLSGIIASAALPGEAQAAAGHCSKVQQPTQQCRDDLIVSEHNHSKMSTLTRLRAKLKEALLLAQRAWRKGKMTLAMSLCVVGMAIGGLVISPNGAKATAVASSFETVKVPVSARGRQRSNGYDRTRPTILSKASVTTDKLGTQTASAATEVTEEVERSLATLIKSFQGVKLDTLIPLVATSAIIPLCKNLN